MDHNLETVDPHDADECAAGVARIRSQRDLARSVAVSLEQETAHLETLLARERGLVGRLTARLTAHGIDVPNDEDDIAGEKTGGLWTHE